MPSYRASCEGKQAYPSRRLAAEALKRTHRVRDFIGKDRAAMEAHPCSHCGGWHIGRKNERSVDMQAKEFVRDPFKKRRKPSKDEAFYREWSEKRTFWTWNRCRSS